MDSGRGGAELWSKGPIDREEHKYLKVDIDVTDAGGLTSTQSVIVIPDDINDHSMKPAAKHVYLWKIPVSLQEILTESVISKSLVVGVLLCEFKLSSFYNPFNLCVFLLSVIIFLFFK